LILGLSLLVSACGGQQPPPFTAVVETKDLMDNVMERQADIVWNAVGTIVTAEGVEERRPKTDEEWQALKAAAINLTETGNLLMIAPRAQDGDRWMQNVQKMMAQGERMIAAIDRKNPQDVFDVGSDLYDTCTTCHMQYMPAIRDMYR
jgi:basic membrane lipoprotein Med (substrate-binding protein (PBP1-ABC) superfamily)